MELETFITSSPCVVETVMGYDIIPQLQGRILASAPVKEVQILGQVTIAPYEADYPSTQPDFFSLALNKEYDHILFYYSHDYMYAFLSLLERGVTNLVLITPYPLDLNLPHMQYYKVGFPTIITYESKSFTLHDPSLPFATAQRANEFSSFYSRVLVLCPDEEFVDTLLAQEDFRGNKEITEETRILCVVDEEARLLASDYVPDCVIDTCQTRLLFNTTMGGYYKRLVHRSKVDADAFALLSSFRREGLCHRMSTESSYQRYLEEYPWPKYLPPSINPFPTLLPLSKKNNQVMQLWLEQGYPASSLLGPLVLLDNFSPLLFVYPLAYEQDSYLFTTEQHYKTFFYRFVGEDSLDTLCKLWQIFLEETGSIDGTLPSMDQVRVWANNNSISMERLWTCLELVRKCMSILAEGEAESNILSEQVYEKALPLLQRVYSKRLLFASGVGFEYKSKIYTINTFALPSNLGSNTKEIIGLILDRDLGSVIAGVNF
ncbi:Hypothetical protein BRZCDTV_169 [Brazilian cedratvirus IHUMI]|uniref:Uncharacterized protein n=1 Tax=Brazilian cedratvirus IHUMI TaxID=2126980 RepID=A0A2R8FDR3_9VIRU|nr:Hypothetical protein BRZCDTV_169 [Brazilian cedratvirus IHUMI]